MHLPCSTEKSLTRSAGNRRCGRKPDFLAQLLLPLDLRQQELAQDRDVHPTRGPAANQRRR